MTNTKKNILFYIGTLNGGGAERMLIELLKNLNRRKYKLFLALNRPQGFFFDQVPSDIIVIDRSPYYKDRSNLLKRFFGLASIIKDHNIDLAMGFLPGANRSLMRAQFFAGNHVSLMLNEQNNPSFVQGKEKSWFRTMMEKIEMSFYYPDADGIVVACEGLKEHFIDTMNLNPDKIDVIHNMINREIIETLIKESVIDINFDEDVKTVVAAGRLTEQKAYSDMLKVFKRVHDQVPARLIILGEGKERENIEKQINEFSLAHSVFMPGFVENPFTYFSEADIYLSTSHWEGFHLTIVEAMACGTVPIATDCDYGPREIITDGKNGRLLPVGDIEALSDAIIQLLNDDELRKKMSVDAWKRSKDFNVDNIVRQYEEVFDEIIEEK